jgi:hypothetical protein
MRSDRLRIPGRHAHHEHRARIGLPEHGRSILARRVIRRRPFCVIRLEPLRRRAHDLSTASQSIVAPTSVRASANVLRLPGVRAQPESPCRTDASRRSIAGEDLLLGQPRAMSRRISARFLVGPRRLGDVQRQVARVAHHLVLDARVASSRLVLRSSRRRRCGLQASRHRAGRRVKPAAGAGQALLLSFSPASPGSASRGAGRDPPGRGRHAAARPRMRSAWRRL